MSGAELALLLPAMGEAAAGTAAAAAPAAIGGGTAALFGGTAAASPFAAEALAASATPWLTESAMLGGMGGGIGFGTGMDAAMGPGLLGMGVPPGKGIDFSRLAKAAGYAMQDGGGEQKTAPVAPLPNKPSEGKSLGDIGSQWAGLMAPNGIDPVTARLLAMQKMRGLL